MNYTKELHDDLRFYKPTRDNPLDREIAMKYQNIDVRGILLDRIDELEEDADEDFTKCQDYINSMIYWRNRAEYLEKVINDFTANAKAIMERE